MAGSTPFFGLSYFDFRDRLDTLINVRKEIDRFMLIDKQLYGMYLIFGNGIIEGWEISPSAQQTSNSISVDISAGYGIINYITSETFSPETLSDLPANDQFDIYAIASGSTVTDRIVRFVFARSDPGNGAIRIATVTTGSNNIATIDRSSRDEISFLQLIRQEIANHKHRGSPSKIDLLTETRNQLPGARLEDFDASKIATGRFSSERIPQLDHNDLVNNGLLSHAALDSFVRNISSGNRELLGEVAGVNMIKQALFAAYNDTNAIEHMVNLLPVIPGITPDYYIDFENSTANINLKSQCISGKPNSEGQITSVIWETTTAFLTAYDRKQVTIATNEVALTRGGGSTKTVENFEDVPGAGANVPGFTTDTVIIADNLTVTSEGSEALRTEGFYSGKFDTKRDFRALYTKKINTNKDWSIYDELVLDIKSLSITHGAVYMYFVNGTGENAKQSETYLILGEDEITTNPDPNANGFERRALSISEEERSNISEIVFYTDDVKTSFVFYIDNIFLRNQALYPESGYIKFRYSGGVNVLFNSVIYEGDVPSGTQLRVRARSASSSALLNRASFTPLLNTGDIIALNGTDAEIEIVFLSNAEKTSTPVLSRLELQIITSSEINGFRVSEATDWDRGTYVNISRTDDLFTTASSINISPNVPVNDLYYSRRNVVHQQDPSGQAVLGLDGLFQNTPENYFLSPKQAVKFANSGGQFGFNYPYSVYRLSNRNFIVADTDNDRVIETTPEGEFVRGVGSHNIDTEEFFYPLTALYNDRTGIMTCTFTKEVDADKVDLTKIQIRIGGAQIFLGANETIQDQVKGKRILEILLSRDKREQLSGTTSNVWIKYTAGSFPSSFESPDSLQNVYDPINGLRVFIGDFTYIEGISHPVYANEISNGDWMICNSKVIYEKASSADERIVQRVQVGSSASFTVEVPVQPDGISVRWEVNVPTELSGVVTYSGPDNVLTVNVNNPTTAQIKEWNIPVIARYIETATGVEQGSDQNTVVLIIYESSSTGQDSQQPFAPVVQIEMTQRSLAFSYDAIEFSDFTLGSVFEIDEDTILIAGLFKSDNTLPQTPGTDVVPENETFEEQAQRKLKDYRGKVVILDKTSKTVTFEYDVPDLSYASDAVIDGDGLIVVAETSFVSNSGRVVKLDTLGNVVWQIGGGLFSKINDVRALHNGHVVIST